MALIDGQEDDAEKKLFSRLEGLILKDIDLKSWEKSVEKTTIESYHEANIYRVTNRHSIYEKVYRWLQQAINPGDYKFPRDEK